MKKAIIISTLLFFGLELISAQSKETVLEDIRSEYKTIRNNITSYVKKSPEIELNTTEGGLVTAYLDNKDLRLIEIIEFGETGKNITQYYFKNRKLFFAFDQQYRYNTPIYNEEFDANKTTIIEDRYYFHKEKLFLWLDTDKNKVDLTLQANKMIGKKFIDYTKKLKHELKKEQKH
ncbi:hypothetical protein [Aquimarina megaterium]|uniref:hypothetical protein n=1 Tax=Aquimarina megaterium TaxID=1443666 RepID=UPI00046EF4DE|nr:hypothetical protein [Aquimarina megaterium]